MLFQKLNDKEKVAKAFLGISDIDEFETIDNIVDSENNYANLKDDEHVLHLWEALDFEISDNYEFVNTSPLFLLFSNLLYTIAFPILYIFNKLVFNFKVYGRQNILKVKTGKITISNHAHIMDCTMIGLINYPYKTYFLSLKSNFKIPVVNIIIRLLNAIPIPDDFKNKRRFFNEVNDLLKSGKTLHIYPEASLWPYYTHLREFKEGAFRFAFDSNVPIIPMVYKFEKPNGIWKFIKKKPLVRLHILEPIYPDLSLSKDEAVSKLKKQAHDVMEQELAK